MKSREPVLVRGRDYWDEVNLPESAFRARIAEIRERMERDGVDALLVYGRGDQDGHLCYVSNLVNKVPNWGLLVSITQDDVLVRNERSSRTRPVIERGTWIEDIEFCDNVVEDVESIVGDPGTTIGTAGFDRLPYRQRRRFEDGAAAYDVVAFDDVLSGLRADKSRRERDQIARAGRILTDVHDSFPTADSLSTDETTLAGEADRRARLRGAQDFRFLVSNPAETEPHLRPAEETSVGASDPLVLYTAVRYEGYWAECARTRRLDGEPPYAAYDDAVEAYATFLDGIRAGRTTTDVVESAREAVADMDLELAPEYDFGHGIGLAVEENPALEADGTELTAGMTVSARLAVEPESDGLIVLNDTLELRDGRPRILTGDWW